MSFSIGGWWVNYDRLGRSGAKETDIYEIKRATAAAMGLQPACSKIIYDYTHTCYPTIKSRIDLIRRWGQD